jgi:hypothetical protein
MIGLLALSMTTLLGSSASAAPTHGAIKAKDPDKEIVCIEERPVGSHLYHKYCATRLYWELRTAQDQRALSSFYSNGPNNAGGSGGMKSGPTPGGLGGGPH